MNEDFKFAQDDPLAAEHAAVAAWVHEAVATIGERLGYMPIDLQALPSGKTLLAGKPHQARRYVMAAVAQVRQWDMQLEEFRARASNDMERMNVHLVPGWNDVWLRRRSADAVISTLIRKALPFEGADLVAILDWCSAAPQISKLLCPLGQITRAVERFASKEPIDLELGDAIRRFAAQLRSTPDSEAKRLGNALEKLCAGAVPETDANPSDAVETRPAPPPAPAGTAGVLTELKKLRGMIPGDTAPSDTMLEPDQFTLADHSPLEAEHKRLSAFFESVVGTIDYHQPDLNNLDAGRALLRVLPRRWRSWSWQRPSGTSMRSSHQSATSWKRRCGSRVPRRPLP